MQTLTRYKTCGFSSS